MTGGRTSIPIARVVELSRQGRLVREIAEELRCSTRAVERARARAGIGRPPCRPSPTPEQIAHAKMLLDDGASYEETARTVGIDRSSVAIRFPGRGWTTQQCAEYLTTLRRFREGLV